MKLPRSPTAIVILSVVVVLLTYAVYLISSVPGTAGGPIPSGFSVGGTSFTFTYVATTEQERETGLMNTKVTNSTTMLFAFPSLGRWQFYMYDTNTSLDMLWVNATGDSGRVVYLVTGAEPCHTSADSCPR